MALVQPDTVRVTVDAAWRQAPPQIEIRIPGFAGKTLQETDQAQLQVEVQTA